MRIAVDLTPLLPGGENGGAKIMVVELIKKMASMRPGYQFYLLASRCNAEELSLLTADNIHIVNTSILQFSFANLLIWLISAVLWPTVKLSRLIMPGRITTRLRYYFGQIRQFIKMCAINHKIKPDLYFCPFTAVPYRWGKPRAVSVVYDLQFHFHPYFFENEHIFERRKNFFNGCKAATKIVCISDYVKETIVSASGVPEDKVKTIYIGLAERLGSSTDESILARLKLTKDQFLLYPANFWLHKNHQMLIAAFNLYCHKHPGSMLKLVCTGADSELKTKLMDNVQRLGLQDRILMPGFVTDAELGCLMRDCRAVIFPSLYEGFGMPVLEAMANGKPVLCSNVTSLPEVAGDGAVYFDPRRPEEIVGAIETLENDTGLIEKLVRGGEFRVKNWQRVSDMANEYLDVFEKV